MKKRRSVLTFAVVLALAVMLGSCSGAPGNTAQSAKPDASSGGGSESSVQTEEVDPLGKYDEEITITFFGQKNDSVKFKEGEDLSLIHILSAPKRMIKLVCRRTIRCAARWLFPILWERTPASCVLPRFLP